MEKTFIRFMRQEELVIHLTDIIKRFDAWHFPTISEREWHGSDSFGTGWCFFEQNTASDDVIQHYSGDRYKVEITMSHSETYFKKYIGAGVYYPHGQRETATELHIPFVPWWKVKKITITDQLLGTEHTYDLSSESDWSDQIQCDFANQLGKLSR